MAESSSKWTRDILLIPLIVGLVVAFFTYVLPKWLEKGMEISYSIDGPTSYVNQHALGNVTIQVNGVSTPRLFAYKVRLWNSGGHALKDLPVRFTFDPQNDTFQVFNVSHETNPRFEFGKIEEQGSDKHSKRFVYELLNPDDEDVVTLLTSDDSPLNLNSKAEGLRVTKVATRQPTLWIGLIGSVLAAISSLFSLALKFLSDKREKAK